MGPLLWETVQYLSSSTFVNAVTLIGGAVSLVMSLIAVLVVIRVVHRLPPNSEFSVRLGLRGLRMQFARGLPAPPGTETAEAAGDDPATEPATPPPVPDTWQEYVEQEIEVLSTTATKLAATYRLAEHQIEELAQEAVTALADKWDKAVEVGPRRYAFGVMRNKARHLRSGHSPKDRMHLDAVPLPSEATSWMGTSPGAEEIFFAHQAEMRVLATLAQLPERQRQVVLLVVLLERSIAETARELGISPGAVRQALSLAKRTLRRLLDGHDDGEGGDR